MKLMMRRLLMRKKNIKTKKPSATWASKPTHGVFLKALAYWGNQVRAPNPVSFFVFFICLILSFNIMFLLIFFIGFYFILSFNM